VGGLTLALLGELQMIEVGVNTIRLQQFDMATNLYDSAVFQYSDAVSTLNG
jgi:hypothetical protein